MVLHGQNLYFLCKILSLADKYLCEYGMEQFTATILTSTTTTGHCAMWWLWIDHEMLWRIIVFKVKYVFWTLTIWNRFPVSPFTAHTLPTWKNCIFLNQRIVYMWPCQSYLHVKNWPNFHGSKCNSFILVINASFHSQTLYQLIRTSNAKTGLHTWWS